MPNSVTFRCGTGALGVEIQVPEALDGVRALFPDEQVEPSPSPPRWVLREDDEGFHLSEGGGRWSAPSLASILARLELTLAETLVLESGHTGIHASAVSVASGAVLFTGPGGCGKSSLAAALAIRGHPVFGDDVVLTDGTQVFPFRRLLKVEEPARSLLDLPAAEGPLSELWPDASFYHPGDLGSRWSEPAPFRAVVLPRRTGGPPVLEPVAPSLALAVMFTGVVLRVRLGTDDFDLVADVIEQTPCYTLTFEETAAAAALVEETLG